MNESEGLATRVDVRELIRPIYEGLKAQLYIIPLPKVADDSFFASEIWNHYHRTLEEFQEITRKDYSRFRVHVRPPKYHDGHLVLTESVSHTALCQKIADLILRLHTEYFPDKPIPFSGQSSTAITLTQNQAQAQNLQVQMLFDFRDLIDEKIRQSDENSKERSFLEKLKKGLNAVSGYAQFIKLVLDTAKEFGVSIGDIARIFS